MSIIHAVQLQALHFPLVSLRESRGAWRPILCSGTFSLLGPGVTKGKHRA